MYQMKAENNLNSNLRRKSTIVYDFLTKIGFSKNFTSIFLKKKVSNVIFSKIFYTIPKAMFFNCFRHQK